ncbi:hypothetical protein [Streptomyces sp. NBC_01506]|uniref:hypothetical protein n=1 Tax=Streptomyces sp. NBC_01506 TaxID=2903887 RepID=UPI00386B544D
MAAETMTAGELTNLRLGTLDGAVSDWEKMFAKLNTLATGEGGGASAQGLQTQTQAADWKGANATISREFVIKTAAESRDVAAQARSILGILRDSSAALKRHKSDLRALIDEVAKKNIYINDNGTAIVSVPSGAAAGKGDIPSRATKKSRWPSAG